MQRPLRSNFERGSAAWALRRAQWLALGLSDADMEKPKIAVVNTSSDLASCFIHLDGVAAVVKQAVRAGGGLPLEIRTAAPADFIQAAGRRGSYRIPSQDLIARDIEAQVEGAQLDGMVVLASCEKTTPGQLLATARLDIPAIVVCCGYQPAGEWRGDPNDVGRLLLAAGHHAAGALPLSELEGMSATAIRGPGACAGLGAANALHIVAEALGLSLPGSAPVLANSPRMFDLARRSGTQIMRLVSDDIRPRAILTEAAFANAVMALMAVAGPPGCLRLLGALAREAGITADPRRLLEQAMDRVPVLAAIRPIGSLRTEALEAAGGTMAVLKRLESLLHGETLTVTGRSMGEEVAAAEVADEAVVRPLDRPLSPRPGIVLLRGSLCPGGGLVRPALGAGQPVRFAGRARCFTRVEDAMAGLRGGVIRAGDVVVLRGSGSDGGVVVSPLVFALDGAGLAGDVAVVTDGHVSGLASKGLVMAEVAPDAAAGGPIGLIEDGDRIEINLEARRAELRVDAAELDARRARLPPHGAQPAAR
ncbi:dihydroxy-acid dehydratase [Falsiroseomonas sp.]|uniref:dihydroxy-acid dehydratase domain-containing protein n=1 Tax=Falsiroseomonas sp. TaxID=2870721 RepID=UPI0035660EF6